MESAKAVLRTPILVDLLRTRVYQDNGQGTFARKATGDDERETRCWERAIPCLLVDEPAYFQAMGR
jgi:hypothetical protein